MLAVVLRSGDVPQNLLSSPMMDGPGAAGRHPSSILLIPFHSFCFSRLLGEAPLSREREIAETEGGKSATRSRSQGRDPKFKANQDNVARCCLKIKNWVRYSSVAEDSVFNP